MEGVTVAAHRRIRSYCRRRGYQRLNSGGRRRKGAAVVLPSIAEGFPRRRRFWRLKIAPTLKLKFRFSPKKFLLGLRDAYVNMMLKLANTRLISRTAADGLGGFGGRSIKEYDEWMVVEIYKSIVMAQGQIVPRDAAWIGSEIACNL